MHSQVVDSKESRVLGRAGLAWKLEKMQLACVAVMAFAKASGEVASLSAVDIRLIALAHTLEVAAHGFANLRSSPPAPRTRSKSSANARKLPGWGEEGADWDALDQDAQDSQGQQCMILPLSRQLPAPPAKFPICCDDVRMIVWSHSLCYCRLQA